MVEKFYKLVLTFNSTALILVVFAIKDGKTVDKLIPYAPNMPSYISYCLYILIPILTTYLSVKLTKYLSSDDFVTESNKSITIQLELANNAYLPSYLGYFFVALSVPNAEVMIYVYSLLFIFTYLSQTLYFNPLFLILGFNFYYLTTLHNKKVFMITKNEYNIPDDVIIQKAKRINSFTFIHIQEETR